MDTGQNGPTFERKLPTEDADVAEIVRDVLIVQAQYATAQKRPLGRGTHTKGVCVRATFEVLDISRSDRAIRTLAAPAGARPLREARRLSGDGPVRERGVGNLRRLEVRRPRDVVRGREPAGVLGRQPTRLDYSMNNAPTFPINDAHAFAAFMRIQCARPAVSGAAPRVLVAARSRT